MAAPARPVRQPDIGTPPRPAPPGQRWEVADLLARIEAALAARRL